MLIVNAKRREDYVLMIVGSEYGRKIEKLIFNAEVEIYNKANNIVNLLQCVEDTTNESNMIIIHQDIDMN